MALEDCICQLLYRHNCLIIPGFGGFIGNFEPASIDLTTGIFEQPYKKIIFSVELSQNDGMLIEHITKQHNISSEDALEIITDAIKKYRTALKTQDFITIDRIGKFYYENKKLLFKQDTTVNYLHLKDSAPCILTFTPKIKEEKPLVQVILPTIPEPPKILEELNVRPEEISIKKKEGKYSKYYRLACIMLLTMALLGGVCFKLGELNERKLITSINRSYYFSPDSVYRTLSRIPKPDTTHFRAAQTIIKRANTSYFIIAECYKIGTSKILALNRIKYLQNHKFSDIIIDTTEYGIYRVGFGNFNSKLEALRQMMKVRKTKILKDAWIDKITAKNINP